MKKKNSHSGGKMMVQPQIEHFQTENMQIVHQYSISFGN